MRRDSSVAWHKNKYSKYFLQQIFFFVLKIFAVRFEQIVSVYCQLSLNATHQNLKFHTRRKIQLKNN